MRCAAQDSSDDTSGILPVQEVQSAESAVSCLCFGQERSRSYVLLAVASDDGSAVIFRCPRTEMERAMVLNESQFPISPRFTPSSFFGSGDGTFVASSAIAVHTHLKGHANAISSVFFSPSEDMLVTISSEEMSARFWDVDSGEMLQLVRDIRPLQAAMFLPLQPDVFLVGNSSGSLRLIDIRSGTVLQKVKAGSSISALASDATGSFVLAGSSSGSIYILASSGQGVLALQSEFLVIGEAVIGLSLVRPHDRTPAYLLATTESSVCIIDFIYAWSTTSVLNLAVRERLQPAFDCHAGLRCCCSPSGGGHVLCSAEDVDIHVHSLSGSCSSKVLRLKRHQAPVRAVTTNLQDTLIASGDALGRIVLWRRLNFV